MNARFSSTFREDRRRPGQWLATGWIVMSLLAFQGAARAQDNNPSPQVSVKTAKEKTTDAQKPADKAARSAVDASWGALKFVPADVSFYQSILRTRERVEVLLASRAWARLLDTPLIKDSLKDPENPLAVAMEGLKNIQESPQQKEFLDFGLDLLSQEICVWGGKDLPGLMNLIAQVQRTQQLQQFMQEAFETPADPDQLVKVLEDNLEQLNAPDVTLGFRVKDTERAKKLLDLLEEVLRPIVGVSPQIRERFDREKIGGGDYITIRLDGGMIPESLVPASFIEQHEKLWKHVQKMTLSLAIGIKSDYMLVSIGKSTEGLAKLGTGELLADRTELKPLRTSGQKILYGIGYVSPAMRRDQTIDIKAIQGMAKAALAKSDLSEEEQAKAVKDIDKFLAALSVDRNRGAALGFTYLAKEGVESLSYDWSEARHVPKKGFTILNHLGGTPLLSLAIDIPPAQSDPADLKTVSDLYNQIRGIMLKELEEEQRDFYTKAEAEFLPLLKRGYEVLEKKIGPGLGEGEIAMVLDARLRSKQWHGDLPKSELELPLPEVAFVRTIKDAAKIREGAEDLRVIINDAFTAVRRLNPDAAATVVPEANVDDAPIGKRYWFPIPANLKLDARLRPQAGLTNDLIVLTLSNDHTDRLLKPMPLQWNRSAEEMKQPSRALLHLDFAGLLEATKPWIVYAMDQNDQPEEYKASVLAVIDFLKCLRSYSSRTYREGDTWVTHTRSIYQDLPQ